MFCCTKNQSHFGQIINAICLEEQCIKSKNQLMCPSCIQQQHQGHTSSTMKKMIPEFLAAHKDKQRYSMMLRNLLAFVVQNFGEENNQTQIVTIENIVDRIMEIMLELKNQVDSNNQEIHKMKDIFKNLNKNTGQSTIAIAKSVVIPSQIKEQKAFTPQKSVVQTPFLPQITKSINFNSVSKSKNKNNNENAGSVATFSHLLKHPYLSLSSECHTVSKSSHPGHRYTVMSSKSLSENQNEVHLRIDVSSSGNVMIGLCHQSIVKQKDFVNSYGIGHGTYLIGQNGNNSETAISFHHTNTVMNRKQIIGWNFKQGEVVTVGFNFYEEFIYFKLHKDKGKILEFDMALVSEDFVNKEQIKKLLQENGLKIVVLLQNIGDQVTLIEA